MKWFGVGRAIGLLSMAFAATAAPAEDGAAFFKEHCFRCHDAGKQKGDFRLDTLSRDFEDALVAQTWAEVMGRINAAEMPPEDEAQPGAEEVGAVVDWISGRLDEGRAARMAKRGPVAHYRLSREEYGHTVYDLLGVYFDVDEPGAFNEDPRWHGFNRIGSMLSLSPSHVDRYYAAAETVVNRAFPAHEPRPQTGRQEANDDKAQVWLTEEGLDGPVRWLLFPGLQKGAINAPEPGLYRIRIQLSALPSFKGRLPHLSIWNDRAKSTVVGLDVVAPEDQPKIVEIETFLPQGGFRLMNEAPGKLDDGHTRSNTDKPFISTRDQRLMRPTGYQLYLDDGQPIFPLLIVDWVEWEGPILTDEDRGKRDGLLPEEIRNPKPEVRTEELVVATREALKRFADRAWRRPATDAEIERYVRLFQGEVGAGEAPRSAYLAAMVGILTSKNFSYIVEGEENPKPGAQNSEFEFRISDFELASRLSYFLWSSMPDEALLASAAAGELHEPEVLQAQLTRMMSDAKVSRFTDAFPRQWLQLHRVGQFAPDADLYPDYDAWLEESMKLESARFFAEVFEQNLTLSEFLKSDWTMLNPRLAMHYGMPAPATSDFQRVALRPDDHRGGILTQASVLSLTSDGTRHRPVHRGVWISEAMFAKTPPPPPPNVEPLEPTPVDQPKATIRMQIEGHATNPNCAACHRNIDPLGFAFDNYDAIGRWRTNEVIEAGQGDDPAVDASGVFPDGRAFGGPAEFQQLLVEDRDRFAAAFVEQLATFALRRVMTIDDAGELSRITEVAKSKDYRLRDVIEAFVLSELFVTR